MQDRIPTLFLFLRGLFMSLLILGLCFFLGIHSAKLFFPELRANTIERFGEYGWKAIYSIFALLGFTLIVMGYAEARYSPIWLWYPAIWLNYLTNALMLFCFLFMASSNIPGNRIKAKVKHPLLIATKIWAFAHLISNPTLADFLLFGSFLVWAVLLFRKLRRLPDETPYSEPKWWKDAAAISLGLVTFVCFGRFFHPLLIGVSPFPHG